MNHSTLTYPLTRLTKPLFSSVDANQNGLEDAIARELQQRKLEDERKKIEVQRICKESEEIKTLKQKIQYAYMNKERTSQIAEAQLRKIKDIKEDCELESNVLRRRQNDLEQQYKSDEMVRQQRVKAKQVLQQQMTDKMGQMNENKEQYLKEKQQIDVAIEKLLDEDRRLIMKQQQKKEQMQKDMQVAMANKVEKFQQEQSIEQKENEDYLRYMKMKDNQQQEIKQKKDHEQAVKEKISSKLKEEEEKRKYEEQLINDLRFELHQEQFEAINKQKEQEELYKKLRVKEEYQKAEVDAKQKKMREVEHERENELNQRNYLQQQFTISEQKEQQLQMKRKYQSLANQQEVEKLISERRQLYEAEREKERQEYFKHLQEEKMKEEIIKQEREKLLKEHIQNIGSFIPKGVIKDKQELLSFYSNTQNHENTRYSNTLKNY